jgi:hypothetical protein
LVTSRDRQERLPTLGTSQALTTRPLAVTEPACSREVAGEFFHTVVAQAREFISDEHCTVCGTLLVGVYWALREDELSQIGGVIGARQMLAVHATELSELSGFDAAKERAIDAALMIVFGFRTTAEIASPVRNDKAKRGQLEQYRSPTPGLVPEPI